MAHRAGDTGARLDAPDPSFRLTPAERASIQPGFDVDALEHLLAILHPDLRTDTLASFQRQAPGVIGGGLIRFEDPVLQALLDEVWAPRSENAPQDWFHDPDLRRYPGREIAMRRRGLEPTQLE
ncbi:hypothetical protein [Longimicrobium sp.]|uniref:hypothetical protein n=1 Tax=Longimicrobium sp. TaxID=2029185 RepID=UPI002E3094B7|nr:hypothetical protein [Longimicrobium sp.]HEX6038133.1 hypothetical protein [Longimicrobium sp.]